jgi:hypothetical protein
MDVKSYSNSIMTIIIEIPIDLTHFQLPEGVQGRLTSLLDRQDTSRPLTAAEQQEAEGLVELAEFLTLLSLRSRRVNQ